MDGDGFDLEEEWEGDIARFIADWDEADSGPGEWLQDPSLLPSQ